jgi:hypothetical protein
VIAEPCRVSVPLIGVRDPGGVVWSRRRFIRPAFGEVLIFPSLCEHLVLVVAFTVLPRGLLWRLEPAMPFQQLVLEGSLRVGKDQGGA